MQLVGRLTQEPGVPGLITGPATYFVSTSAGSRRAVVRYWQKYVYEVLVNRLGGLSPSMKSGLRLTDNLDMTLAVNPVKQQHNNKKIYIKINKFFKVLK